MNKMVKKIAHRGLSKRAPENTKAAFQLALEEDFFGIECDIWKSLDGKYVISHDENLNRMCNVDKYITEITYEEILTHPIVNGVNADKFPDQHLLRLEDYLQILVEDKNIHPIIELKMPFKARELGDILTLVKGYGLYDRTYFISMHKEVLMSMKEIMGFPKERLQYVYGIYMPDKVIAVNEQLEDWLIETGIGLDSRYNLVKEENIENLHKHGILVNAWTIRNNEDKKRLEEAKIDMLTIEME